VVPAQEVAGLRVGGGERVFPGCAGEFRGEAPDVFDQRLWFQLFAPIPPRRGWQALRILAPEQALDFSPTESVNRRGMPDDRPPERPTRATEAHLRYLDDLREGGVVNVFGAGLWLEEAFGLDPKAAGQVLIYWIRTFSERHPRPVPEERPR
jgi:hypothetical protein